MGIVQKRDELVTLLNEKLKMKEEDIKEEKLIRQNIICGDTIEILPTLDDNSVQINYCLPAI